MYEKIGYLQVPEHHLFATYWCHVRIYEYLSIVTYQVPRTTLSYLVPNAFVVVVVVAAVAVVVRRNTKKMLLLTYRDSNGINDRKK